MQEPFNYAFLGTIAGSAAATTLIVELIKDIEPAKRCPTRWLVIITAELITILTAYFNGDFAWNKLLLFLLNGLLASSAAMTGWHVTKNKIVVDESNSKEEKGK